MIFELLLKHLEKVLLIHRDPALTQLVSPMQAGFVFCRVEDLGGQVIELAQEILKREKLKRSIFN